jgi:hypothetical protein
MYEFLIGKTLEEAASYAKENGLKLRISASNGTPLLLTCDLNPGRLNIEVEEGLVRSVKIG